MCVSGGDCGTCTVQGYTAGSCGYVALRIKLIDKQVGLVGVKQGSCVWIHHSAVGKAGVGAYTFNQPVTVGIGLVKSSLDEYGCAHAETRGVVDGHSDQIAGSCHVGDLITARSTRKCWRTGNVADTLAGIIERAGSLIDGGHAFPLGWL